MSFAADSIANKCTKLNQKHSKFPFVGKFLAELSYWNFKILTAILRGRREIDSATDLKLVLF